MCVLKCAGVHVLKVCEHMSAHTSGDQRTGCCCSGGAVRGLLSPHPQNQNGKCDCRLHECGELDLSPQAWTSELCWLARLSSPCIHFLGFLFSRFFLYLCVCVCGHMCTCEHRVPWRLEEGICSFWARVVVSWQLPSMGDRSRTPVLWAISQPWEYFHHGSLSWCSCSVRIRIHIRTCSPGNLSTDPSSRHSVLRTRELSCLPASSFWLAQTYLKLNVSVLTHLSFYHKHFNPSGLWIGVCVSPTSPSLGAQGQTRADSVSDELSH